MTHLTWYPGTILPHASLWHTLLRAAWLNELRSGDFEQVSRCRSWRMPALHHGRSALYRRALSRALGDGAEDGFRFGTLDQWPRCLFPAHVVSGLRWCPECLRSGYHTLLASLRLVARCPIHDCPLIEACPDCHDGFKITVRGLSTRSPMSCGCGRVRLLEPQTCRQPSLSRDQVQLWNPVAAWLRQVGSINAGLLLPCGDAPLHVRLALTSWWCRDLNIAYPCCFEPASRFWATPDEPNTWSRYFVESGELVAPSGSARAAAGINLPVNSPPMLVYKSMARHLRRHGLRCPDSWIVGLMTGVDPVTFADQMKTWSKARLAFVEMLWARTMEPDVHRRRWPIRRPAPGYVQPYSLLAGAAGDGLQAAIHVGKPLSSAAHRWVAYHVTALAGRMAWNHAQRLAEESIANRWADWSRDRDAFAGRIAWYCRRRGKRTRFVAYIRETHLDEFCVSSSGKAQRSEVHRRQMQARQQTVAALEGGPCLLWDDREGWRAGKAARADPDPLAKRVRLLHVAPRADCWIYRSDDRFIARWVGGGIQTSAGTPLGALNGMRRALTQYRKTFQVDHACPSILAPKMVEGLPDYAARLAKAIRQRVLHAGQEDPFWLINSSDMVIVRHLFWQELRFWQSKQTCTCKATSTAPGDGGHA